VENGNGIPERGYEETTDVEEEVYEDGQTDDERVMPFLEHLEELRWRILWSLVAVAAGSAVCYYFVFHSDRLFELLTGPAKNLGIELITLRPIGMFLVKLKATLIGGFVLALPVVIYQVWAFIAPGLLRRERRYVPAVISLTFLCFLIGALVAYFAVFPLALRFMAGMATEDIRNQYNINDYVGFMLHLLLAFGGVFELPVLSFFLSKIGLLTPGFLRRQRKYAVVAIVVVAAIITPPDVLSQLMMVAPLLFLYEVSILVSRIAVRSGRSEA